MIHRCWAVAAVALMGCTNLAAAQETAAPKTKADVSAKAKSAEAKQSAEAKTASSKFVRIQRDRDDEVSALQTAIVTYHGKAADGQDIQVDLIGAVHIGDTNYYEQLNKAFRKYEVVLYELVAPKGARPGRGQAGTWGPIAGMLSLDDQILRVDYQQKNFLHADMSWDEMMASMEKRQESFLNMFFRMIGQGIAQESVKKTGPGDGDLLAGLLFSNNPSLVWKRTMAGQFEDSDKAMGWLEGPDGSTLISERNKVALQVLAEQIAAGKRNVAVFYGAGHLPDMERRLINEFKLQPGKSRWLTAWDLSDGKKPMEKKPGAKKNKKAQPPQESRKAASR